MFTNIPMNQKKIYKELQCDKKCKHCKHYTRLLKARDQELEEARLALEDMKYKVKALEDRNMGYRFDVRRRMFDDTCSAMGRMVGDSLSLLIDKARQNK